MVSWFFWLAMMVTVIFFILTIILFVCQWVIYYRIEQTILRHDRYANLEEDRK